MKGCLSTSGGGSGPPKTGKCFHFARTAKIMLFTLLNKILPPVKFNFSFGKIIQQVKLKCVYHRRKEHKRYNRKHNYEKYRKNKSKTFFIFVVSFHIFLHYTINCNQLQLS